MFSPTELRRRSLDYRTSIVFGPHQLEIAELYEQVAAIRDRIELQDEGRKSLHEVLNDPDMRAFSRELRESDFKVGTARKVNDDGTVVIEGRIDDILEAERRVNSKPRLLKASEITKPGWYCFRVDGKPWGILSLFGPVKFGAGWEFYGPIQLPE